MERFIRFSGQRASGWAGWGAVASGTVLLFVHIVLVICVHSATTYLSCLQLCINMSINRSACDKVPHVALVRWSSFDEGVSALVLQVLHSFGCREGGFPMPISNRNGIKNNETGAKRVPK